MKYTIQANIYNRYDANQNDMDKSGNPLPPNIVVKQVNKIVLVKSFPNPVSGNDLIAAISTSFPSLTMVDTVLTANDSIITDLTAVINFNWVRYDGTFGLPDVSSGTSGTSGSINTMRARKEDSSMPATQGKTGKLGKAITSGTAGTSGKIENSRLKMKTAWGNFKKNLIK